MLLRDFASRYLSERDVSRDYCKQIGWTVDRFARFLTMAPQLSDLTSATVNCWLDSLCDEGLSRRTVCSQRINLLCLWRAAHFERLVDSPPLRIKKIACPAPIPRGESVEKVALLLAEARKLTGSFQRSRVPRAAFWAALILFLWESGLRLGDVLRVEQENVTGDLLMIAQHKTGWPIMRPLSVECQAALAAIASPERRRIFGDALSRGHVFKGFRRLAKAVDFHGGTKTIRKSGASAVEAAQPGAAMSYLGHKTPGLAYRHYVDPRLIQRTPIVPPPLKD